jgi:putative ABC transport system substrate-binding protein
VRCFGGVAAWSLTARAQMPMPVIGFLSSRSSEEAASVTAAFRQGLSDTGYVEGQNLAIVYRWAEGRYDRLPELAADLVARRVDLITATGGPAPTRAAMAATTTIPIVFVTGDPVKEGLAASLARPGGNATGFSLIGTELTSKRLELLTELVPKARVIGVLVNPNLHPQAEDIVMNAQQVAQAKGLQLRILKASNP